MGDLDEVRLLEDKIKEDEILLEEGKEEIARLEVSDGLMDCRKRISIRMH